MPQSYFNNKTRRNFAKSKRHNIFYVDALNYIKYDQQPGTVVSLKSQSS